MEYRKFKWKKQNLGGGVVFLQNIMYIVYFKNLIYSMFSFK